VVAALSAERSVAQDRLERCRSREGNRVRDELLFALSRVPKDSLIFNRAEVDAIADALGGYTKLAEVLDGPR
jgi:hypothetical protein